MIELLEAIKRIALEIAEQGIMQEITDQHESIHNLLAMAEHEDALVFLDSSTDQATAFTIGFPMPCDPHQNGLGIILSATLSTGSNPDAIGRLYRQVRRFAEDNFYEWIYFSKRIAPSTYTGKYVRVRNKYGQSSS